MSTALLLLEAILVIAAGWDVAQRRIPNPLVLCGLLLGPCLAVYDGGWSGLGLSVLGAVLGFGLTFPQWALKLMGGGDAKLFVVVGAFLGPLMVVDALIWSLLCHGLVSVAMLGTRRVQALTGRVLLADTARVPMAVAVPVGCGLATAFPLLQPVIEGFTA
ncbi:MAG TPA: prepilin peptidase [Myxococcota bacterium]|nr:prepilin peptidase [Myxococcota bacterium]